MKQRRCRLEIAVETRAAAEVAEQAGADRVELCVDLSVGGVTPGVALMRSVRENVHIPIFAMIRPRAGDFVYSPSEFDQMKSSTVAAVNAGMDGLVFGILTGDCRVDIARTKELVASAQPLPVTFHRAFDACADLAQAIEDVLRTGAARILTSGGAATAFEGVESLARLVAAAGDRVTIIPGGGINAENILQVAKATLAKEFHSGLSTTLPYPRSDYRKFADEVKKLATSLVSLSDQLRSLPGFHPN